MAKNGASKGGVREFVKDIALGAMAGATVDGFIEVSNAPYLNELSPIPIVDPTASNAEAVLYGSSLAAITLGLVDVVGGKSIVPGYGRQLLAYGIGVFSGTMFYELEVARYLGLRDTT